MSSRRHGFIRITRTDGRTGVIDGGAVSCVLQDTDVVNREGKKETISCLGIVLSNNVTLKVIGETEESLLKKVSDAHGQTKIDIF
jgi:hypothetical protein